MGGRVGGREQQRFGREQKNKTESGAKLLRDCDSQSPVSDLSFALADLFLQCKQRGGVRIEPFSLSKDERRQRAAVTGRVGGWWVRGGRGEG